MQTNPDIGSPKYIPGLVRVRRRRNGTLRRSGKLPEPGAAVADIAVVAVVPLVVAEPVEASGRTTRRIEHRAIMGNYIEDSSYRYTLSFFNNDRRGIFCIAREIEKANIRG